MKQNLTDRELFDHIQNDDKKAFRTLFDRHYKNMCYTAYKIYPDEHKAKDFAQEVFLNFWKRRNIISIELSVSAFLKRAVVNKAIDYIRSQKLDFNKFPTEMWEPNSSSNLLEYKELKQLIHQTADKLPQRCRIIFFMSRFESFSHKEIAQKLNISEKTVENQITKALKILRNIIADYNVDLKLFFLLFSIL
jgi:RNA polymerase sigma-70 factor (ECF subfamily)